MDWLTKTSRILIGIAWVYVLMEALTRPEPATFYQYHMSFHEKWYPSVLRGEWVDHWLPPGYVTTAIALPFNPVVSFRIVSIVASLTLCFIIMDKRGWLLASSPLLIVFGSRAQPDSLMCLLAIGGTFISTKYAFPGGFLFGLSSFIKPVGIFALPTGKQSWMFYAGAFLGAIPFIGWFLLNGVSNVGLHFSAGKDVPFIDSWRLVFALFFLIPLFCLKKDWKMKGTWMSAGLFLAFAFWKAPLAHEYYLLPFVVMVSIGTKAKGWGTHVVESLNSLVGIACAAYLWRYAW